MYFLNKLIILTCLMVFLNFFKSVNSQVCKIMVDKCDDKKDVCSSECELRCDRSFGVCVPNKGIAYCHCFNKESRKNWQKEFRNKFKQLREEIIKEYQEDELKKQPDDDDDNNLNSNEQENEEMNKSSKDDKTKKTNKEDDVKKSKKSKDKDDHSDL